MSKLNSMLIVALILGLGWAIRGHFGHEWGASWAGAMAGLAVLLIAQRKDWTARLPVLTALSAVGWAVGGMMSYGIVIGYCRGTDFGNVLYGYAMLAVIGGLYGFIGGGLLGLGLESTEARKPRWASVITEMVAGAWIVWGLIIYQLEWFMTPPRSELWAACLGAALALAWYLYRDGYHRSLRVAIYAMLGAGIGFSFGNFIQTLGAVSGISYNWWNVMEFTLGFCGGLGLAYAILTSNWPETVKPSKTANWLATLFVVLAIPLTNLIEGFHTKRMVNLAESLEMTNPSMFIYWQRSVGVAILVLFFIAALIIWRNADKGESGFNKIILPLALFSYSIYYMVYGFMVKGFFFRSLSIGDSDALYTPILLIAIALWFFNRQKSSALGSEVYDKDLSKKWVLIVVGVILLLIIITFISINSHSGIQGFHERFE
jgi:hypothetical protein